MTGKVKWFNSQRGYGFITEDDGSDLFVHYSGINGHGFRTLEEGQNVSYDKEEGDRGAIAVNVSVEGA